MESRPIKACLLVLFLLTPLCVDAQEENDKENHLNVDLQILSRGEIRNGGLVSDDDNPPSEDRKPEDKSSFILNRERLVIGYQRKMLDTKLNMQHVRVWGQEGTDKVNVYEAWVKLYTNGLFAQLGRQVLMYDDERILGPDDWSMTSLTHDALRLGYEGYGHKAHAILAYNQNLRAAAEPGSYYVNGSNIYKTMQTLWYHYNVPKFPLGASLFFMNIGMQSGEKDIDEHIEWQQVFGGYVQYAPEHWSLEGSYYRQAGKNETGVKIDAWMASVKGQWNPIATYNLEVGYDYLSGDEFFAVPTKGGLGLTRHEVIKGFSPIYGSHHKFYGAMDFFYVSTWVNGFSPGLQNIYIGGTVKPLKGLSLTGRYHYLAITANLDKMDKTLGHEIELEGSYQLMKDVKVSAGFSYMTGTETMERLKRASNDGSLRWGWLSLNISPTIFTTKW